MALFNAAGSGTSIFEIPCVPLSAGYASAQSLNFLDLAEK
jgi:hypothetical protein